MALRWLGLVGMDRLEQLILPFFISIPQVIFAHVIEKRIEWRDYEATGLI